MELILVGALCLLIGIGVGMSYYRNMLKHNPTRLARLMAEADALAAKVKSRVSKP